MTPLSACRMVNTWAVGGGKVRIFTETVPARSAVLDTMTRSDVAAAASMSIASVPVPVCAMLSSRLVVTIAPLPPGEIVPALVSVPTSAVVPELNSAPCWLMKTLVPPVAVKMTSPVTVPKFWTVLLKPMLSMAKSVGPETIVPKFIRVVDPVERSMTPAQQGPPTTVPKLTTRALV